MKVSVCMWAYNRAKWLQEAIDSVLLQKGVDVELVILNNGSSPDSGVAEVLSQYTCDTRFVLLHTDVNGAHRHPAHFATGDYITNLPDDDRLLGEDSLYRRAVHLRDTNVAFVFSTVRGHDVDGTDLGLLLMGRISAHDVYNDAALFDRLFIDCFIPYPSGMYRRENVGLLDSPAVQCIDDVSRDWAMWVALSRLGSVSYLAGPTVSLRQHAGQDTNSRGVLGGGFTHAHLALWQHYMDQGHIPSVPDAKLMARTFAKMFSGYANALTAAGDYAYDEAHRDHSRTLLEWWNSLAESLNERARRPKVVLAMIVKNEEVYHEGHCVRRLMDSCKDLICGVVALCTDQNTGSGPCQDIISSWCDEHGKCCETCRYTWQGDFSKARNALLGKVNVLEYDYLLLLDADEVLVAAPHDILSRMASLSTSAWVIPLVMPDGSIGTRVNLVRKSEGWSYTGSLHETLLRNGYTPSAEYLGDVGNASDGPHVTTPGDGARSQDPDKLEKDIAALQLNQSTWRDRFFLAQLLCLRGTLESDREAHKLFVTVANELRTDMAPEHVGFIYVALLMMGRLCLKYGENPGTVWIKASEICPTRVEALGELAQFYASRKNWAMCRVFALACVHAPAPTTQEFLEPQWQQWRGLQLVADASMMLGHQKQAEEYYTELSRRPNIPPSLMAHVHHVLGTFKRGVLNGQV